MACPIMTFNPRPAAAKPASRPVVLYDAAVVAGSSHVPDGAALVDALHPGCPLELRRDAGNAFDPWAVEVLAAGRGRIGYVSCECNQVVARLLDGGWDVRAMVANTELIDGWARIETEVMLHG